MEYSRVVCLTADPVLADADGWREEARELDRDPDWDRVDPADGGLPIK